jgi:hypothetical protein
MVLLASGAARAQPVVPASLEWDAQPACSEGSFVLAEVSRILHGSVRRREVVAKARLEKGERAWHVVLLIETEGGTSRRAFDAESCEAAVDGVALIIAIAVDPQAATAEHPVEVAPSAPAELVPTETRSPAPAPTTHGNVENGNVEPTPETLPESLATPQPAPRVPLSFGVTVSLATDAGSLPKVGVGGDFAIALRLARMRLEVAIEDFAAVGAELAKSGAGADFHLVTAEARVAYAWRLGKIWTGPFVSAGVEWMSIDGFGGTKSDSSFDTTAGILGGGGFLVFRPFVPLGFRLALQSDVPLSRPSFVVTNTTQPLAQLFKPSVVSGRALFGAELEFK